MQAGNAFRTVWAVITDVHVLSCSSASRGLGQLVYTAVDCLGGTPAPRHCELVYKLQVVVVMLGWAGVVKEKELMTANVLFDAAGAMKEQYLVRAAVGLVE